MDDLKHFSSGIDSMVFENFGFWHPDEILITLGAVLGPLLAAILLYIRHRAILLREKPSFINAVPKTNLPLRHIQINETLLEESEASAPDPLPNDTAGLSLSSSSISLQKQEVLPDGDHAVDFPDGTLYSGEFLNGNLEGRGVLVWPSGDRYEGEWKQGKQHGQGTFAAADGSYYFGGFKDGLMDGDGVYKPAPPASIIYLRSYKNGVLVKETSLIVNVKDARKKQLKEERKRSQTKAAAARPLQPGEIIYKGHHSYDLMRQLQMGIMYSIAQDHSTDTVVKSSDFSAASVQIFPAASVADAPAFKWKNYAPHVFEHLRKLFGIDNADYLISLTGGPALRELASSGQSGCIFFLSADDRFLIKSVRKEEMELLLELIKQYHGHVEKYPGTMLNHFYGIHRVSPWLGRNARFLVMGNVLPTDRRMHRKYDLKGSTYKRTVGAVKRKNDPGAILKDLDLDLQFELQADRYTALLRQLTADAEFLESLHVIDYSLLLGVYFVNWGESEWYPPFEDWPSSNSFSVSAVSPPPAAAAAAAAPATASPVEMAKIIDEEGEGPVFDDEDDEDEDERDRNSTNFVTSNPSNFKQLSSSNSMAAGKSLVETLESLTSAGILEPSLSRTAASVVSEADSSRQAARVLAASAEASTRGPSRLKITVEPCIQEPDLAPTKRATVGRVSPPQIDLNSNLNLNSNAAVGGIEHPPPWPPPKSPFDQTNRYISGRDMSLSLHLAQPAGDGHRSSGWAVPAVAVRKTAIGAIVREPVLLYFGIIDFLQRYNTRKRAEHAWKSSLHGSSVSVADPKHYSKRFLQFFENVFVPVDAVHMKQ